MSWKLASILRVVKGKPAKERPSGKMERHPFQAPKNNKSKSNPADFSTHGPKLPDWKGDEIQGPSGFWALMGKEANLPGENKTEEWS